jgi:hypothetical protein
MQWWGALTQQFQSIAAAAVKDVAAEAMKSGMTAKGASTRSAAKKPATATRAASQAATPRKAKPSAKKASTASAPRKTARKRAAP